MVLKVVNLVNMRSRGHRTIKLFLRCTGDGAGCGLLAALAQIASGQNRRHLRDSCIGDFVILLKSEVALAAWEKGSAQESVRVAGFGGFRGLQRVRLDWVVA